ncbi:mitochondrial import receptor subunit TOM7 homolog isoform X1 [Loxodonta africana]|uniref:mitochondrial import receptor subunit TOM7 homolog isoform X1 n=1 Tax=Loxodonta africana TaxID=9785 RepID=UPI0030D07B53
MVKLSKEAKQRLQQLFKGGQFAIRWGFIPLILSNITIDREKIEVVKDFILLGSTINSHGSSSQEIKTRIASGKCAAKDLFKVLKSKDATLKTKDLRGVQILECLNQPF